jgi:hypothetical protein
MGYVLILGIDLRNVTKTFDLNSLLRPSFKWVSEPFSRESINIEISIKTW